MKDEEEGEEEKEEDEVGEEGAANRVISAQGGVMAP